MTSHEVVVVGGGIEGLATAWALTELGVTDVLVLERATLASAGTGKSSGVVRCHYGVSSLAAMALRGTEVFEQANDLLGTDIGFNQCGYVVAVGPDNVEPFTASVRAQQALGVDTRLVGADDVNGLWPDVGLDDLAAFAWEPRGGAGDAYSTAMAYAATARRAGAETRQMCCATALLVSGERVIGVRTEAGDVHAGTVVVAAGPWTPALVAPYGVEIPLRVHRESVLLVDPGQPLGGVPVFSDLVRLQYVRPERSGQLLLGSSDLAVPHDADPDAYSNTADAADVETAIERFTHRFPKLDPALSSTYAGCYDVTPDFNPVISATGVERLFVATGFSGHGFKISAAVGELMADLVVDGRSRSARVPAHDFRLSRFAEGDLTRTRHPYAGAGEMR